LSRSRAKSSNPRSAQRAPSEAAGRRLAGECTALNEAFNQWIVHHTPFVTVKAAMTLDGKIATASGNSKWITGEQSRAWGMKLRCGSDAILAGVNTILADDPALTARTIGSRAQSTLAKPIRRIVLDSLARTPLGARVVSDDQKALTTIVASRLAPRRRLAALARRVDVLMAPLARRQAATAERPCIDLGWLLRTLGRQNVTSLLVEGGGEVNASFLLGQRAHRVAFFYAPKVLGGRAARKGVAGLGARNAGELLQLQAVQWRQVGGDLFLSALVARGGLK
jgi:diaminohydroxyphosphoribosylaminopyrimidine deaminase/5-amino-6-(5-phosphoribosylamino)uracil reductase